MNNRIAFIPKPVPAAKVTDTCHILGQLITSAPGVIEYLQTQRQKHKAHMYRQESPGGGDQDQAVILA